MKKIEVNLKDFSYPIFLKSDLLSSDFLINFLKNLSNSFVIITHSSIKNLYAKPIFDKIKNFGLKAILLDFLDSEENKTRSIKEKLEDEIFKNKFSKDTLIIAIGGGIVSDMAGFIASTYMRGVKYVVIPTTLLAMIDASIGGKTAVNTEHGKNLIGTIYHPKAVFIDFNVLKTLPEKEIKNGSLEFLKHALIYNKNLLDDFEKFDEISEDLIIKNILIKKAIVEKDENENSLRKLLNFGHTISHAIEAGSNYNISHGEALAYGILTESHISYKMNMLSKKEFDRILNILIKKDLLVNISNLSIDVIFSYLEIDKKNISDENRFTLLKKIGKSVYNVFVLKKIIKQSLLFAFGGKKIC
ncbi:MAG: 3-dehydroquinate synthase [Parachlamydiales bacterium]|nr:3-dehydroquinate synthase [Parachlamydiales bacterium]